jgi:uncharacterized protein YggE
MATLTVRGQAVVDVEPGRVEVGLFVTAMAATADEAYAEVTARAAALAEVLDELGVPTPDRVTEGLALSEEQGYPGAEGRRTTGYRAWSRTRVRLADVGTVGTVIGRAVAAGAGIDGVRWLVDMDHPARLEACRRAAEAAQSRARAYADELGLPLGPVVTAVEAGTSPPVMHQRGVAVAAAPSYPVDVGSAQVGAAVDVTFELEDASRG